MWGPHGKSFNFFNENFTLSLLNLYYQIYAMFIILKAIYYIGWVFILKCFVVAKWMKEAEGSKSNTQREEKFCFCSHERIKLFSLCAPSLYQEKQS